MEKTAGQRIRDALNQKNMKQIDLVKALRDRGYTTITDRKISDYICNRRPILYKAVWDIAEILDVDPEWLITGKGRWERK